jgi:hypothetical protein
MARWAADQAARNRQRSLAEGGGRPSRWAESGFEGRVLPVTLPVAAAWGRQQYAQPLPVIDALIAATARVHGMTVVTRNARDFELAGVQVLNPFPDPAHYEKTTGYVIEGIRKNVRGASASKSHYGVPCLTSEFAV